MAYVKTDESTVHGLETPHGIGVSHKFPTEKGANDIVTVFNSLSADLYPTGRAFYLPNNNNFYNLHTGLNRNFIRVLEAGISTIDSAFPDNDNFNIDDVRLWEYRLGLISNESLDIETRRLSILRKLAHPKNVKARQHPFFIQQQLQDAGFDVYIHENKFFENGEWVYKTPSEVAAVSLINSQHADSSQHGDNFKHGSSGFNVIANNSGPNELFSPGASNLNYTFFIGGPNLGDYAIVAENRLVEFKELVLKLKPAQLVAFTFINFV